MVVFLRISLAICEAGGSVTLTFFTGEGEYFYGDFKHGTPDGLGAEPPAPLGRGNLTALSSC